MQQKNHLKVSKFVIICAGILFSIPLFWSLKIAPVFSAISDTVNFQGKIVRNDAGHEGLNITTGSPSCVLAGSANDTCDFRVRYFSTSSGGSALLTEVFENVEIGQYMGVFNLALGSDPSPSGTYNSLKDLIGEQDSVYIEVGFAPGGAKSYTEVFTRMPLQASAYAVRAKYADFAASVEGGVDALWSSLQNPVGDLVLGHSTHATLFNWATGTLAKDLFSLTTNASANGTGTLLNIQTGASATVSPLRVRAGSNEAIFVNSQGRVGIGATNPTVQLTVGGSGYGPKLRLYYQQSAYDYIYTDLWSDGAGGFKIQSNSNHPDQGRISFIPGSGVNALLIANGGNVGIGTTSPTYKLDVSGNTNLSSGSAYYIAGTSVLNTNTLGANVTNSSLTKVGTLSNDTKLEAVMIDNSGNLTKRTLGGLAFEDGVAGDGWGGDYVITDNSLIGIGVEDEELGLNLGNENAWLVSQGFSKGAYFAGVYDSFGEEWTWDGVWDEEGNIGLGTLNPYGRLESVQSGANFPASWGNNLRLSGEIPSLWFRETEKNKGIILGHYLYEYQNQSQEDEYKGVFHFMSEEGGTPTKYIMTLEEEGNVGIGTSDGKASSLSELFTVGSSNPFTVSSNGDVSIEGNLSKIKGVSYTWPGSNPASGKSYYLKNDVVSGVNNLTWEEVKGWLTGIGTVGQVTFWGADNTLTGSNDLFWDNTNKRLGIGTSTPTSKLEVAGDSMISNALGDMVIKAHTGLKFKINNGTDAMYLKSTGELGVGNTSPAALFSVGSQSQFRVNSSGVITRINDLAYASWPSSHVANGFLKNDGAGGLSWAKVNAVQRTGTVEGSEDGGQVSFWSGEDSITGDNNLYWDNINKFLGIGTKTPTAPLDISSAGGLGSLIKNSSGDITIEPAQNLIISQGDVGIGTDSPDAKLHIIGDRIILKNNVNTAVNLTLDSGKTTTQAAAITFKDRGSDIFALEKTTTNAFQLYDYAGGGVSRFFVEAGSNSGIIMRTKGTGSFTFMNDITTLVSITSSGKVGIGTTTPSEKLTIHTQDQEAGWSHTNGVIKLGSYIGSGAAWLGTETNHPLYLLANQTPALTIATSGNVGIGTDSPNDKLDIQGNIRIQKTIPEISFRSSDDSKQYHIGANISNTVDGGVRIGYGESISGGTNIMTLLSTVRVGIGTTAPSHILHITAQGRSTSSSWATSSDERIKTNVNTIENALGLITQLNPVSFDYIDGSGSARGFIAQEVKQILPEMVQILPQEEYNGQILQNFHLLDVSDLTPLLVRAVQEQQQMIGDISVNTNGLLARVQQLENQYNSLNQEINLLNNVLTITSFNTLTVDSHLLSKANNTYNLGSSSNRWKNIYTQGVISIGKDGNSGGIKYDTETKELKFSNDGTNWVAFGSTTNTVTLSAQYPGSVTTSEDIKTGVGEEETGYMHYYEFNNIEEDTESVEISVRYTLPSNFVSWTENAIRLYYTTECIDDEDCSVDMEVFKQETPNKKGKSLTNTGLQPEEWTTTLLSGSQLENTCTEPGDTCIITIRLHSKDSNYARVGDIKFNYNRKF